MTLDKLKGWLYSTALCCPNGHKDVAEILIGAKANIEAVTKEDQMPVHLASWKGHLDIVKYFTETLGMDKEIKGQVNKTPLINAAEGGCSDVVKYLLSIGADIEAVTSDGFTPLLWATYKGNKDVADILIGAKANIEALTKDGFTPLHLAAQEGHKDVAEILIGAKANIEALTKDNSMPVHYAALQGHLDIVKYFIETLGIDKEIKGQDNKTPLICAAEGGQNEVVKYLLGIGADIEAVTSGGFTPLHYAAQECHKDVAEILIGAKANIEAVSQSCKPKKEGKLHGSPTILISRQDVCKPNKAKPTPTIRARSGYTRNDLPSSPLSNHSSAHLSVEHTEAYIRKDITYGAILGSFDSNPYAVKAQHYVSPLVSVPKKRHLKDELS
ncbi:serine/threonine-protein phosphatase 6 regulatory ankyrin repeat subunit A-like [Ptychodera flava]|uniref:serine/threonine-protein phosphatase 6 regulatory ankyrin repeat subunit A-like n=1 Tax=Ptychodera flava TaxID=63121 RepID=UPI003969F8CB